MAFTYNLATLQTNPRDWARMKLGDTVEEFAIFQDEEIQAEMAMGVREGLTNLVNSAIVRVGQKASMVVSGPRTKMWNDRLKALEMFRKELPTMKIPFGDTLRLGGISVVEVEVPSDQGAPFQIPTDLNPFR